MNKEINQAVPQVKPKGRYERKEFNLIGKVLERIKTTVYRHSYECKREPNEDGSAYIWHCVQKGYEGRTGEAKPSLCKYMTYYYQLRVKLDENETDQIVVYKEYVERHGKEKIWTAIEDKHYIDKRLLFVCHKQKKDYKLVDLKELAK